MPVEIPLPSGQSITVKDNASPGDKRAVRSVIKVIVEDGKTLVEGNEEQWFAFLGRIITGWSYPVPIPAEAGMHVLDEYPDKEEDDDALHDALQERFDRVTQVRRSPNSRRPPAPTNGTSTGS
jgi:hypothetical protein